MALSSTFALVAAVALRSIPAAAGPSVSTAVESCAQPCALAPHVLLEHAAPVFVNRFSFPVVDLLPIGFSRGGAFAYVVSDQVDVASDEGPRRGWSIVVVDLKTDEIRARRFSELGPIPPAGPERDAWVKLLTTHGVDGQPMGGLVPAVPPNTGWSPGYFDGWTPGGSEWNAAHSPPVGQTSLRPFPLHPPGTDVLFDSMLTRPTADSGDAGVVWLRRSSAGRQQFKAVGRLDDAAGRHTAQGAVLSPWEPRVVLVWLQVAGAYECPDQYGGVSLLGAHLTSGSWSADTTSVAAPGPLPEATHAPFGCL